MKLEHSSSRNERLKSEAQFEIQSMISIVNHTIQKIKLEQLYIVMRLNYLYTDNNC